MTDEPIATYITDAVCEECGEALTLEAYAVSEPLKFSEVQTRSVRRCKCTENK